MEQLSEKFITSEKLPLVIEPRHRNVTLVDLLDQIEKNKSYFRKELLKHGGILFRNFAIDCEKDFVSVIRQLEMGEFVDYIGGDSPRKKIIDGVYTSTEAPPNFKIPLHNELSFVKNYPKHIYFYCETPSKGDGQTILCDARKIY